MMANRPSDRWSAHPVAAWLVRAAVVLVPLTLSVLAAVAAGRLLPVGHSTTTRVGWWLVVFAVSTAVLLASDRIARRVLPLAVLLELSLVFPDRAPSRLRSVRTASVRDLEGQLARLRARGAEGAPLEAAETLVALVGVLGLHDRRTRGHSERVRAYVDLLTDEMGLSPEERNQARWAALMHDLGKLTVPASTLTKVGGLDDGEWESVRRHPDEGLRLAAGLLPWLGEWGRAIGEHHERWDGLGYPNGFAGEQIALPARILAVADAYEVMTSARSYSRARPAAAARAELTACAGAQFDPHIVRTFLSISLGRMRRLVGPLAWLADVPILMLERGGSAARLATATLGVGAVAVTGGIGAPSTTAPAAHPSLAVASPGAVMTDSPSPSLVLAAPSAATRPATVPSSRPSLRPSGPAPAASGQPARTAPSAAGRAPTDYWFSVSAGAYQLTAALPTRTGSPQDVDGDGRAGYTLAPTSAGFGAAAGVQRLTLSRRLDRSLHLSGMPVVTLWSRLAANRGNARVQVQLESCGSGAACVVIADGQIEDGTWSAGSFVAHTIDLSQVDVTIPAGGRFRLSVIASDQGTSGPLLVAIGSKAAPSGIVLPVR
jgi:HD-GYP domain-containing protein (c-di-GMP phosphodiesterase class II)